MSSMNSKDIKHLAQLARLHLDDEQVDTYAKQFDEIVGYVDKIKEFSVEEDSSNQFERDEHSNIFREDIVSSYQNPEQIINESPEHQDNFVKVKKILNQ